MSRWVFGGLLSAAALAFTLGTVWASIPNDLVTDYEAGTVVGGRACQCTTSGNCVGNGSNCSGYGICGGGGCAIQAAVFSNGSVCGGCQMTVYATTSGCGTG
jgi:hypothetical protein